MDLKGNELRLLGRHFLANVALPENSPQGLFLVTRDPRKQRKKPDAYVCVIEEVGDGCFLVKPGDKVVIQRWEYEQQDVDDERLIAHEDDLIVLNGEIPAPGIIIVQLNDLTPKTPLYIPENARPRSLPSYQGTVICHSNFGLGRELMEHIAIGKTIIFQKSDSYQWHYGDGRMAIKKCAYFDIMAILERVPELQII